jgi:hypothetical protein
MHPTIQGRNFVRVLRESRGVKTFKKESTRDINAIDSSQIETYLVFGSSLGLYSALDFRSSVLAKAGFLPPDFLLAPVIPLADFQVIFELLGGELRRLHYLRTRTAFEHLRNCQADELELFAYYLDGCPKLDLAQFENHILILSGHARLIEDVYEALPESRPNDWPGLRMSWLVNRLVSELERDHPTGWVATGLYLLDVPFRVQESLDVRWRRLWRMLRNTREQVFQRRAVIKMGPISDPAAQRIVLLASKGIEGESLGALIQEIASTEQCKYPGDVCVVYGTMSSPVCALFKK